MLVGSNFDWFVVLEHGEMLEIRRGTNDDTNEMLKMMVSL